MSSKTRQLIWSVPLMATLAVVGALAVFVALGLPNADPVHAQDFTTEPGMPADMMLTAGNGAVTVVITQPGDPGVPEFDGYKLQYNQDAGDAVPAMDDSGWMDVTGTVQVRRGGNGALRVTGLTNGVQYFFRAAVTLGSDVGPYYTSATEDSLTNAAQENEGRATPMAGRPGMPMVTVLQTGEDMIKVTWEPPSDNGGSDITGYVAQIKLAAGDADDWQPRDQSVSAVTEDGIPEDVILTEAAPKPSRTIGNGRGAASLKARSTTFGYSP